MSETAPGSSPENEQRPWDQPYFHPEAEVSLLGQRGKEVAHNTRFLSAFKRRVEECGPAYYIAPDGGIGVKIDEESAQGFRDWESR